MRNVLLRRLQKSYVLDYVEDPLKLVRFLRNVSTSRLWEIFNENGIEPFNNLDIVLKDLDIILPLYTECEEEESPCVTPQIDISDYEHEKTIALTNGKLNLDNKKTNSLHNLVKLELLDFMNDFETSQNNYNPHKSKVIGKIKGKHAPSSINLHQNLSVVPKIDVSDDHNSLELTCRTHITPRKGNTNLNVSRTINVMDTQQQTSDEDVKDFRFFSKDNFPFDLHMAAGMDYEDYSSQECSSTSGEESLSTILEVENSFDYVFREAEPLPLIKLENQNVLELWSTPLPLKHMNGVSNTGDVCNVTLTKFENKSSPCDIKWSLPNYHSIALCDDAICQTITSITSPSQCNCVELDSKVNGNSDANLNPSVNCHCLKYLPNKFKKQELNKFTPVTPKNIRQFKICEAYILNDARKFRVQAPLVITSIAISYDNSQTSGFAFDMLQSIKQLPATQSARIKKTKANFTSTSIVATFGPCGDAKKPVRNFPKLNQLSWEPFLLEEMDDYLPSNASLSRRSSIDFIQLGPELRPSGKTISPENIDESIFNASSGYMFDNSPTTGFANATSTTTIIRNDY